MDKKFENLEKLAMIFEKNQIVLLDYMKIIIIKLN
jgi:hypothetical protein